MRRAFLGLDTSCYTTSCALVGEDGNVEADVRMGLPVPRGERGLRQSEAVFTHLKQLPAVLERAFGQAGPVSLLGVCASGKPVDAEDSYMPVFQAGVSFGKALAVSGSTPFYLTTHQRGHLSAAEIGQTDLPGRHLAVHLSGGTTEILLREGESIKRLGGTGDISAGQLLDRVGVELGAAFPAGPYMESLAEGGHASGRYPASFREGRVSFSGAETAAMRDLRQETLTPEQVAAELFDHLSRSLARLIRHWSEQTSAAAVLVTGGVASSALLRNRLESRLGKSAPQLKLLFGKQEYAGDNAVGVARIGLNRLLNE